MAWMRIGIEASPCIGALLPHTEQLDVCIADHDRLIAQAARFFRHSNLNSTHRAARQ